MKKDIEANPIEVYSGTLWQAGIVKSLLLNSEIESYMQDAIMGTLYPWWTSPGGDGVVRVVVSNSDYAKALAVVEEYIKNSKYYE